jgi:hypothetical protein
MSPLRGLLIILLAFGLLLLLNCMVATFAPPLDKWRGVLTIGSLVLAVGSAVGLLVLPRTKKASEDAA